MLKGWSRVESRDFLTWILGTFWNGGRGWDIEKKDEKKQVRFPQWHAWGGQQKPISSGLLFFMQYMGNWVGFNFCICKLFEFLASISSSVRVHSGIVLTDLPASEFGTPMGNGPPGGVITYSRSSTPATMAASRPERDFVRKKARSNVQEQPPACSHICRNIRNESIYHVFPWFSMCFLTWKVDNGW